jgi:hypothetical protein
MSVVGRHQQEPRRVGRTAGDNDDTGAQLLALTLALHHHLVHLASAGAGFQPLYFAVPEQSDVGILQGGTHADHFGVGLGVHQAGIAVAGIAANAATVRPIGLVEQDGAGCVRWAITGAAQAIGDFLDAWLVTDRWMRIRRARRWIGRIVATLTMNMVELLGLRVIRLQIRVVDRPVLGHAVGRAVGAKIGLAQAEQRRAEKLGRAADEVMHTRLERLLVTVDPDVGGHVAVVDKDLFGVPVLFFARQVVAALDDQDAFAGGRELERQRAATGTAADDDDIVVSIAVHWLRVLLVGERTLSAPAELPSGADTAGDGKVGNWTMSFEKKRSSVQSIATRTFLCKPGSLLR